MYCPNCGKELLEGAKFCPDCGEKIEAEKSETINTVAEKVEAVEKEAVVSVAEKEEQSAESAQEKSEPTQPAPVNTVPPVTTNPAPANASFEISSNGKISSGKKGRTKFKDLSPKQKAIRLGIGGLLLLIGIIWMVSDGVKGSEKAGSDYSNNSISEENENENAIKVIPCNCDTGAVFNMTLEEFSKSFDNQVVKWEETDPNIYECWGSPSSGTEDSGTSYQLYSSKILDDTFIYAKVIDNHVAGIVIGMDYTSDTYKDNLRNSGTLFNYSVLAFGKMSDDEEQEMWKNLADGCDNSKTRTSYISEEVKYTIIPDRLNSTIIGYTLTIDPVSEKYVSSLNDNIIYNDFSDSELRKKTVETEKEAATPIMSDEQAVSALYAASAFKGNIGYETAVEYGTMEDVSIGEVLDYMFTDPTVKCEAGDNCVYVTISGIYYINGSSRSSGNVTYRVDASLDVTLDTAKSKSGIESTILEWASYLANT